MKTSHLSAAVVSTLASFLLVAGCSSAAPTAPATEAKPAPDKAVVQQDAGPLACTTFEACPNVACFCGTGIVNARGCNEGRCLDTLQTCTEACKGTIQGDDAPDPGGFPGGGTTPSSNPAAAAGDPCVPVSASTIVNRVGAIAALIASHQVVPATPAFGAVNVVRDNGGAITRIAYDSPNNAEDYVDSLTYDRAGRLQYWAHDGAGSPDVNETFVYGLAGQIVTFSRTADGPSNDMSERFLYDLRARLIRWSRNMDGNSTDLVETFSYDNGLIERFEHNGDGPTNDMTEKFSYDSSGRVTNWNANGGGMFDDASVAVSYNGASQSIQTNGNRAAGATISFCKK